MKITNIIKICKKSNCLYIYDQVFENAEQWVGDCDGIYPLYGMPYFTPTALATLHGIPEKKQNKISFSHKGELPLNYDFEDTVQGEEILNRYSGITFMKEEMILQPYRSCQGTIFVNTAYLSPFSDMENIELYLRTAEDGSNYIAVKQGMILYGIILPWKCIDKMFVEQISKFAVDCKDALILQEAVE